MYKTYEPQMITLLLWSHLLNGHSVNMLNRNVPNDTLEKPFRNRQWFLNNLNQKLQRLKLDNL